MDKGRRQFFSGLARSITDRVIDAAATIGAEFQEMEPPDAADEEVAIPPRKHETAIVRPPGAIEETQFLEACTRGHECAKACPYDAIRILNDQAEDLAGTPVIIPENNPCYLCIDTPCIDVCESGALRELSQTEIQLGTAHIDLDRCKANLGEYCDYCIIRCPIEAYAISRNDKLLPVINPSGCAGCGVCSYLCPTKAIEIEPRFNLGEDFITHAAPYETEDGEYDGG